MTNRTMAIVAGAAAIWLVGGTTASAQSVLDSLDGFYFSGSGGVGIVDDLEFDLAGANDIDIEFDIGYGFQGAVGYRINRAWRVELEGSYISADVDTSQFGTANATSTGSYDALSGSFNVYLDFGRGRFSPYLGAGIGYSNVTIDQITYSNGSTLAEIDDSTVTGQLMLGLGYEIDTNLRLTAEYRFRYLGDIEVSSPGLGSADETTFGHFINVGLKYEF